MELTFGKEDLWEAMQTVGNVAASRNTLPILANVLIRTAGDVIQLAATDLEVGVTLVVRGQIVEPGSITIPARKLADIVRELPSTTDSGEQATVKLSTLANDRVEIDCENAKFRIVGLTDEEFPPLPDVGDDFITLKSNFLRRMVQKTAFAVSTEETRHFLNGIHFSVTSDSVRAVATDGRRLAVATRHLTEPVEQEMAVIIPTKAVNHILRTFADDESDVRIALLENQIVFATQDLTLISRLIEGEYPDYQAVMAPAMNNEVKLVVGTEHLLSVYRRVSLLANPKTPMVKMESKDADLSVSASTPELGEAREQMQVEIEGGSVEIAFNARYVMDVLHNVETSEVVFRLKDSSSPVLVTPLEDNDYICVIMPMRL